MIRIVRALPVLLGRCLHDLSLHPAGLMSHSIRVSASRPRLLQAPHLNNHQKTGRRWQKVRLCFGFRRDGHERGFEDGTRSPIAGTAPGSRVEGRNGTAGPRSGPPAGRGEATGAVKDHGSCRPASPAGRGAGDLAGPDRTGGAGTEGIAGIGPIGLGCLKPGLGDEVELRPRLTRCCAAEPGDPAKFPNRAVQDLAIKEQDRAAALVLGRDFDVTMDRQVSQDASSSAASSPRDGACRGTR